MYWSIYSSSSVPLVLLRRPFYSSRNIPWLYYYYYYFIRLRVIHTGVSWWFLTGVCVTAVSLSLQDSSQYSDRSQQFNNDVVWIVFIRPLISKSSSPCTNSLVTVPSTPITTGITVILMIHFFSLARFRYLSLFSLFFKVYSSAGSLFLFSSFFFLC